jgi:hypothetical protein
MLFLQAKSNSEEPIPVYNGVESTFANSGEKNLYYGQVKQGKWHGIVRVLSKNFITEGQYKDGEFEGWSRTIWSKGNYQIGWFKHHQMHGYNKQVNNDKTKEGLFENHYFK